MICPKCGSNNSDGTAFCASCGAPLSNEAPTPNGAVPNNNVPPQTPPPVWPTSGSNPNGTSVNPNGFDFKSTMEDVGNNLKDKAKELFGENHPSNSSQNQQPVRTAGTCPNCGAELEPGAEYCKKCGYPVEK